MNDDWNDVRSSRPSLLAEAGSGALRIALLFGSAAVALTLIVTPMMERGTRSLAVADAGLGAQLDMTPTGSVRAAGTRYTIRRSVLQSSPDAVCIISDSGSRTGEC